MHEEQVATGMNLWMDTHTTDMVATQRHKFPSQFKIEHRISDLIQRFQLLPQIAMSSIYSHASTPSKRRFNRRTGNEQ